MIPQLVLTLSPEGKIVAELPGQNGSRRQIVLDPDPDRAIGTLERILQNQLLNAVEIGLDGAPTQQQVRHWEKHQLWSDPSCRFCIAEGRFDIVKPQRKNPRGVLLSKNSGIEVRRLPAKGKARQRKKEPLREAEVHEDLGL